MDDMTEQRVKEQLDKEGGPNGRRRESFKSNLTKKGVQMDDMTEKRNKEQLDKEGGPNGRHNREESQRTT